MNKLLSVALSAFPPKAAAVAGYILNSAYRESFGLAFNGQCVRQTIVMELLHACGIRAIVETGTFRGSTTYFLGVNSEVPIYSVELRPSFYKRAKRRLKDFGRVHLECGDSRAFLQRLAANPAVPKSRCFFYLDAHWKDDLPLKEEIELIAASWTEFVILIDDFKVDGDTGYGFDTYGPGKELSVEYLAFAHSLELSAAFPSLPSSVESGMKRGCIVLCSRGLASEIDSLLLLRRYDLSTRVAAQSSGEMQSAMTA